MSDQSSESLFRNFLIERGLHPKPADTLNELINANFFQMNEKYLRELIEKALSFRDENLASGGRENLLGNWMAIIDDVKSVIGMRQALAGTNFQKLVEIGMRGEPKLLASAISKMYMQGQIDYLFLGILDATLESCEKEGRDENAAMLNFFKSVIEKNDAIAKARNKQALTPDVPHAVAAGAPAGAESKAEDSDDSIDSDDEVEVPQSTLESVALEKSMMEVNYFLHETIKCCQGDARALKTTILEACEKQLFSKAILVRVIDDNIEASNKANYTVKSKLLAFIRKIVEDSDGAGMEQAEGQRGGREGWGAGTSLESTVAASSHHAPKFTDEGNISGGGDVVDAIAPDRFIDGSRAQATPSVGSSTNKKKKASKKAAKLRAEGVAAQIGDHLEAKGWAVCDNFLPLDLVRRVRIEADLFTEHYEQSEIWVGKRADVGAHLSVPSVRGDKVLWMCGAHTAAPEGETRIIKTKGEIEPCRLDVKAKAPLRKFHAMKELVAACDKLVEEMKPRVGSLRGIYERSDAMLAVYPGNGSRFARHIDNTSADGRRITMLVYLNPSWSRDNGGALRLTPPPRFLHPTQGAVAPLSSQSLNIDEEVRRTEHTGIDEDEDGKDDDSDGEVDNKAGAGAGMGSAAAPDRGSASASQSRSRGRGSVTTPGVDDADTEADAVGARPLCEQKQQAVDVFPEAGRLAIFYSAEIPHEVMPTYGLRHAITLWYYDSEERAAAITQARESGHAQEVAKSSVQSQQEAKVFIAMLMGGDEVAEDGGDPTPEEMSKLASHVRGLSSDALSIVAGITGAPSEQSFREGFELLTPNDLKAMRHLFRRMGLQ